MATAGKEPPDPHAANEAEEEEEEKVRCYVCETDLSSEVLSEKLGNKKKESGKGEKGMPKRGLVELRSEGTGFAGGGANMAKRGGVAFQC